MLDLPVCSKPTISLLWKSYQHVPASTIFIITAFFALPGVCSYSYIGSNSPESEISSLIVMTKCHLPRFQPPGSPFLCFLSLPLLPSDLSLFLKLAGEHHLVLNPSPPSTPHCFPGVHLAVTFIAIFNFHFYIQARFKPW